MADKNLKISVKSDLREGAKLMRFIQELQQRVEKFAKTLGNINIGGGTGGGGQPRPMQGAQSGLFKQLTDDKRAMEQVGRETENLQSRYRNLGNEVNILSARLQLAQRYMARGGAGPGAPPPWFQAPGTSPGGGAGPPPPPGGGAGAPPTAGGGGGGPGFAGMIRQLAPGLGVGWILGQVREMILNAPDRDIRAATLRGEAQSMNAASVGTLGARMMQSDFQPALGLMNLSGRGFGANRFSRGDLETILNSNEDRARNIAISKGLNWNVFKSTYEMARSMDPAMKAASMNQLFTQVVETAGGQDAMLNQRIQYAQQQAPGRVGFARRFGRDFTAGIPLGSNVDPQQTMATVSAVLDALAVGTNISKVTRVATEAARLGISQDAIQSILRAQEIGRGGNLMEQVLRSGLSRPMMGAAGMAAAQLAESSLLRIDPTVLAGGFLSGGQGTDALTMRQLQGGAGFLQQVTTGGLDPFQRTVNMALATKRGRSVFTSGLMGRMSLPELLQAAHQPTSEQIAAGITREGAQQLLNSEINSLAGRAFSERGVETPQGIRALLAASQGEGGIMGALDRFGRQGARGRNAIRDIEVGLNMVTGQELGARPLGFLGGALGGGPEGERATATSGRFGAALSLGFAGPREIEADTRAMTLAMRDVQGMVSTWGQTIQALNDAMRATDPESATRAQETLAGLGDATGLIAEKGPDAVKVMDSVVKFVDALTARRAAVEEANRRVIDLLTEGITGGL